MDLLLSAPVPLHDVADVEKFCRSVLDSKLKRMGARLNDERYEDALTFLIAAAYEMSVRYDAAKNTSFSKFAHNWLPHRVVDWYRHAFPGSRNVYRYPGRDTPKIEPPLSYDRAVEDWDGDSDESHSGLARIEAALARSDSYCPIPGSADRVGLLAG